MIYRVVTGGRGFLGSAVSRQLAGIPGQLLCVDRNPGDGVEAIDAADVAFRERLRVFLAPAGRAELYLAAGTVPDLAWIAQTSPEQFQRVLNDTVVLSYASAHAFAEVTSSLRIPAAITFLGSVGATRSHRYKIAYDAAMAGVEALARGFALEYAPARLTTRVAAIGPIAGSPSSIEDGAHSADLVALVPANEYPSVDQVATAVITLGGPAFDIATGAIVLLDAGLSQQLCPAAIERRPTP